MSLVIERVRADIKEVRRPGMPLEEGWLSHQLGMENHCRLLSSNGTPHASGFKGITEMLNFMERDHGGSGRTNEETLL